MKIGVCGIACEKCPLMVKGKYDYRINSARLVGGAEAHASSSRANSSRS